MTMTDRVARDEDRQFPCVERLNLPSHISRPSSAVYAAKMSEILVAFDLYGTLLSTASVAKALAEHFGEDKANSIAQLWRRYQLEYTWRLNSMSKDQS